MQPKASSTERHFSATLLLPVVLALVITAVAVLGYVLWSTENIDQRALERQTLMVSQAIQTRRDRMLHDLESAAVWDDAVIAASATFDFDWVDFNLGRWMQEYFGHNRTIVFDADNQPIYMMDDGDAVEPNLFGETTSTILPMVRRLRTMPGTSVTADQLARPPRLSDFAIIEGKPAIISAMTIVSDTGNVPQRPGSEAVLVAIQFLDDVVAAQLSQDYLFDKGDFTFARSNDAARTVYPLLNNDGRFIAFFEWDRDRPGLMLLRQTGPALALAFVIAVVIMFLLLRQLRRAALELDAGRRHAEYQAAHDQLTGLPNRITFDSHMTRMLGEHNDSGADLTLLMLDLDRFKQVNDTLGHQAGDDLIRAVGARLRSIVGAQATIARLGGDEFAILISSPSNRPINPMAISEAIIESIGKPFSLSHFKAHVGVSIGIVIASEGLVEPNELMRKADIALYEAKAAGRNRAIFYEEHMNELLQLQHTIEGELREALRRGDQLSVVFQPLVDQQSRKVIGAEALARWLHPKYGQISPARFIPIAETTGLIELLGDFVLRRACEMGARAPGRTIAVNISPTQLRNPRFSNQVFDILHQTGMRPHDLELEITESILLDEEHVSSQNLRTFRAAGIQIALDDFGTGYSSLSYLKRYPVDRIKIDRSFVSQLSQGHVSVAITQAIVTLAHAMDIEVTAEGVETETQATILGELGCNTLQGFHFSGGVSPEQITEVFADAANAPQRRRRTSAA